MRLLLFRSLSIGLIGQCPAFAADLIPVSQLPPEAQARQVIESRFGKLIGRDRAEDLYKLGEDVARRVAPATEAILNEEGLRSGALKYEILISDNPRPNAAMIEVATSKAQKKVLVVLSSGLFEKMLKPPGQPGFDRAVKVLAGVMAHEFGHLMDKYDAEGLAREHGKTRASQAVEMRTDAEGKRIAVRARLADDCMHAALEDLESWEDAAAGLSGLGAHAYVSTHPEATLRKTAAAGDVTLQRHRQGDAVVEPLALTAQEGSLRNQLSALSGNKRSAESLSKMAKALTKRKKLSVPLGTEAFLRSYVEELRKVRLPISAADLDDAQSILKAIATSIHETQIWKGNLTPSVSQLMSGPLREQVARLGLFNDSWERWVEGRYADCFNSRNLGEAWKLTEVLETITPPSSYAPRRKQVVERSVEIFGEILSAPEPIRPGSEAFRQLNVFLRNDLDFVQEIALRVRKEWVPRLSVENKLALLTLARSESDSRNILQFRNVPRWGWERQASAETVERMRQIARSVWEDREFGSAAEFLSQGGDEVDWLYLWHLLGIRPEDGRRELNAAFRRFSSGPDFAKLLDASAHLRLKVERDKRQTLEWAEDGLLPYAQGLHAPVPLTSEQKALVTEWFEAPYMNRASAMDERFVEALVRELPKASSHGTVGLKKAVENALKSVYGGQSRHFEAPEPGIAKAISTYHRSDPTHAKAMLKRLYFEGHSDLISEYWFTKDLKKTRAIIQVLKDNEVVSGPLGVVKLLQRGGDGSRTVGAIESLASDLLAEHQASFAAAGTRQKKIELLEAHAHLLFDPMDGIYKSAYEGTSLGLRERLNSQNLRPLRTALTRECFELAAQDPKNAHALLNAFDFLAANGPNSETDRLFASLSAGIKAKDPKLYARVAARVLEKKRIWHPDLQAEMAEAALEQELDSLPKLPRERAAKIAERVATLVPSPSLSRDRLAEKMAWRISSDDPAVYGPIEAIKLANWRNGRPQQVNFLSWLASLIRGLPQEQRFDLIEFILLRAASRFPTACPRRFTGRRRRSSRACRRK